MEAELGPAAQGHAKGRGNHRHLGVFDRHGRLLEGLHHHGDIVVGAFGKRHGHHHQVGTDREIHALVANHQADTLLFRPLDRLVGHRQDVAADRVHLRMELETEDAVAQVDNRTAGVFLDDFAGLLENLQANFAGFDRHRHVTLFQDIEVLLAALLVVTIESFDALQRLRHLDAVFLRSFDEGLDADGIEHLERTDFPVEAPAHGVVDIDHIVGDLGNPVDGIDEGVADTFPGELGPFIACADHHLHFLTRAVDLLDHLRRGELGLGQRFVFAAYVVIVEQRLLAVHHLFFVETLAGFVAEESTVDHLLHELRHLEHPAFLVIRQEFVGVGTDMAEGVEADQIGRAERRALRAGGGRTGDGIHLFDGHAHLNHMLDAFIDRIGADPVGDKIGGILGEDDAFAHPLAEEIGHAFNHGRIGLVAGDDLHQPHITRRVEEMGGEEILADFGRQHRRHLAHRQAGGIGGEHGARREVRHQLFQEIELDRHIFDHHLDNPVAILELR
ncbi:MAG: hypothetical protein ACD_75C00218G0001 [uncultured bacterium]|nr:MAG: hypothetical protein ACD_75C00218G0001 [uncultured bacterium]